MTFYNAPWYLPDLLVSSVTGSSTVTAKTLVAANRIDGDFALEFGGRITGPIYHNASALALKSRLEALPNLHRVSVRRTTVPDLEEGYTWSITFFSVGGAGNGESGLAGTEVPLLKHVYGRPVDGHYGLVPSCHRLTTNGDKCVFPFVYQGIEHQDCAPLLDDGKNSSWCPTSSGALDENSSYISGMGMWGVCQRLDCDDVTVRVRQVTAGKGKPEVHQISSFAGHVDMVQTIRVFKWLTTPPMYPCAPGKCRMQGTFRLQLDLLSSDVMGGAENTDGYWAEGHPNDKWGVNGDLLQDDHSNYQTLLVNGRFTDTKVIHHGGDHPVA